MRVVGAPAQAAAYAGDGRVVRVLSVAPGLDDELEEEEAGGKGAAHRATAARGPVSGCEHDAVPLPSRHSSQVLSCVMTKYEEVCPKHVGNM